MSRGKLTPHWKRECGDVFAGDLGWKSLTCVFMCPQMSKAEKALEKKNKAKQFSAKKGAGAVTKNAKRWT